MYLILRWELLTFATDDVAGAYEYRSEVRRLYPCQRSGRSANAEDELASDQVTSSVWKMSGY